MGVCVPQVSVAIVLCATILLLLSTTLVVVNGSRDWTDECPSSCRCKWSSGKKTALCQDAGFTAIPSTLNGEMQVLNLSGNTIPYLSKDAFRSVGLINLQRIFIKGARVHEVHKDAFKDLTILVEVDLSNNLITYLHPDTFHDNLRLKVLYLSGNPLRELHADQFAALPHLRTIELANCHLTLIDNNAFKRVTGLESLNLKDNKLSQLSEAVFAPIAQLKTLVLDGNPWYCDCQLRGFRNWLVGSNLYRIPLPCHGPKPLAGHLWQEVQPERFACAPQVSVTDSLIQVEVGGNVTIGCHVKGDPEPKVTWLYNGHEIGSVNATHPDQVLLIEVEEGLLDKWINISLFNVSVLDVGNYACVAQNIEGTVSRNVTLVLPAAVVVSTLSHEETSWMWVWLVATGLGVIVIILIVSICVCCVYAHKKRRRKRYKRKARLKGSISFTEQEKKLLDLSITTTERQSGADSCEMLNSSMIIDTQSSLTDLPLDHFPQQKQQPLNIQLPPEPSQQPPVHITIESHPAGSSIHDTLTRKSAIAQTDPLDTSRPELSPMLASTASGVGPAVAYSTTLGLYSPPPEFSTSIVPVGPYGNILISVSVSQDPNIDIQGYPDLLDIPHRSNKVIGGPTAKGAVSVAAGPDVPFCLSTAVGAGTPPSIASSYATLPRCHQMRPNFVLRSEASGSTGTRTHGTCTTNAQYDNMGPRVTADGGSSTLSLSDANVFPENIPPPPPPPICSPLTGEYVSL